MLVGSLLLAGCGGADATALDLSLEIPAAASGDPRGFVLVQVRDAADHAFTDAWIPSPADPLFSRGAASRTETIRLATTDADKDLAIRVRDCVSEACDAVEDESAPERQYTLDHPFWPEQTTSYRLGEPGMIDRCEIRGCADGALPGYCFTDGRHLCER